MIQVPVNGTEVPSGAIEYYRRLFEDEYLLRYGHNHENAEVEVIQIEIVAEREVPVATMKLQAEHVAEKASINEVFFSQADRPISTPFVHRMRLEEGENFAGPIIIYEDGSNTVIPPGATGTVIEGGLLMIDVSHNARVGL